MLTATLALANSGKVVDPDFAAVTVQCSGAYAYQSYMGGTCAGPGNPQQNLDGEVGVGWTFAPLPNDAVGSAHNGDGLTYPGTNFGPPSFTGLPFSRAAFLQGAKTSVWQRIPGFVPGGAYTLTFYLGSRYARAVRTTAIRRWKR